MSETPAGWYDDGSGRQRWWDGRGWATEPVSKPAGKRPKWPWVLGGVLLAAGLLGVAGTGVILTATADRVSEAAVPPVVVEPLEAVDPVDPPAPLEPSDVVLAYYQAHEDADCELYFSVTTPQLREETEIPDCEAFLGNLEQYNGVGEVETRIARVLDEDGEVTVVVEETFDLDGEPTTFTVEFYLYADDGVWRIDWVE